MFTGNEYGGLHGREFLGRTLIFTGKWQEKLHQAICVSPPLAQPSNFDANSCRCNWGPIRCGDTKCLVSLPAL